MPFGTGSYLGPNHGKRRGIWRNVGARYSERVKNDLRNRTAGGPSSDDVPQFVNRHHRKPTEWQKRRDKYGLVETFHEWMRRQLTPRNHYYNGMPIVV